MVATRGVFAAEQGAPARGGTLGSGSARNHGGVCTPTAISFSCPFQPSKQIHEQIEAHGILRGWPSRRNDSRCFHPRADSGLLAPRVGAMSADAHLTAGVTTAPKKVGLYDPANEKDACGIGFIADLTRTPTRSTVVVRAPLLPRRCRSGRHRRLGVPATCQPRTSSI